MSATPMQIAEVSTPPIRLEPRANGPVLQGESPVPLDLRAPGDAVYMVSQNAVLFRLTLSTLGTSRKVTGAQFEVDADKKRVRASKRILDFPEVRAVENCDGRFRDAYLPTVTLPSSVFGRGTYVLPTPNIREVEDRTLQFFEERTDLVGKLLDVYPVRVAEDALELKGLYQAADYPAVQIVEASYKAARSYMAFATPDSIATVAPEIWIAAQNQIERDVAELRREWGLCLAGQLKELVDHMVDRLTPDPLTGREKVFKNTLTTNFDWFFSHFDSRNALVDHVALASYVREAREVLRGVHAQQIRDQPKLRDTLRSHFTQLQAAVDRMVIEEPERLIEF